MTSSRLPSSFLLPLLCLLLWVCLVAVPVTLTYVQLVQTAHGAPSARVTLAHVILAVPRSDFLSFAASSSLPFEHVLKIAGLPGLALDLLTSRFASTWPDNFAPDGMDTDAWQAISYPIYALPFWCFVGFGLERLLSRRRLNWPALLLGTSLCAFCLLMAVMSPFEQDPDPGAGSYLVAFSLWVVLFGIFPAAWVLQRKRRRTQSSAPNQSAAPTQCAASENPFETTL